GSAEEQKNKQVVRQYIEVLNLQDTEKIRQLVSSTNYSLHFSGMPPMDWNGSMQFLAPFNSAFPDLRRSIEDIVAEGNKVAVRLNVSGTHKREFQSIPPTSKKVSFTTMDIVTILDGKVKEEWSTADMMGLMRQIGAIPGESHAAGTSIASS
ncbi:MAG: ester cyclase, partial [Thermoproteota archaeon]|nr:ester cyclase [Thermoproteota archaeon]